MKSYIRLIYASKTTANSDTICKDLINIVGTSQLHNLNRQIYGVLFYGGDSFLQCLEGEKAEVDALYQRILKDSRHKNIILLNYETIKSPRFKNWSMKYVCYETAIQEFFKSNSYELPDFYQLDQDLIEPFLNILYFHQENEPGQGEKVERTVATQYGYMLNHKYAAFTLAFTAIILVFIYLLMEYTDTIMQKILTF